MQQQYEIYRGLADCLKSSADLLGWDQASQLNRDLISICHYLTNPNFRIAVFIQFAIGTEFPEVTKKQADLQRLQNCFNQLERELARVNIPA